MATKAKKSTPLIKFTKPATKKLGTILSQPQTLQQKKFLQEAMSSHAFYTKKWEQRD